MLLLLKHHKTLNISDFLPFPCKTEVDQPIDLFS